MPWWWPFSLDNSSKSFNLANQYWKAARAAASEHRETDCARFCIDTIGAAQKAIESSSQNGDAHLLLADGLIQLSLRVDAHNNGLALLERASAVWYIWASSERPMWTKNAAHAEGLQSRLANALQAFDHPMERDPLSFAVESYSKYGHKVLRSDTFETIEALSAPKILTESRGRHRVDIREGSIEALEYVPTGEHKDTNRMGEYQISMIEQEVALFSGALSWMGVDLQLGIERARKSGNNEMQKLFEMHLPLIEMTKKSLLVQAAEQAKSQGTSNEVTTELERQSEILELMQKSLLVLQYTDLQE